MLLKLVVLNIITIGTIQGAPSGGIQIHRSNTHYHTAMNTGSGLGGGFSEPDLPVESKFVQAKQRALAAARQKAQQVETLDDSETYNYRTLKSFMQTLYGLPRYICADSMPLYFSRVNKEETAKEAFLLEQFKAGEGQFKVEIPDGVDADEFLTKLAKFIAYTDVNKPFGEGQSELCQVRNEHMTTNEAGTAVVKTEYILQLLTRFNGLAPVLRNFASATEKFCSGEMEAANQNQCVLIMFFQLAVNVQQQLHDHAGFQDQVYEDMQKVVENDLLAKSPHPFFISYRPAYNAYLDAIAQKVYAQWFADAVQYMTSNYQHTLPWAKYENFRKQLAGCNEVAVKVIKAAKAAA